MMDTGLDNNTAGELKERAESAAPRKSRRRLGIRARILIPLAALAALFCVAGLVFINQAGIRHRERHLVERVVSVSRSIASVSETSRDSAFVQQFVATVAEESDIELILVAAGDPLEVIASTRDEWIGKPISDLSAHASVDGFERALTTNQLLIARLDSDEEDRVEHDVIACTVPLKTHLHAQEGRHPVPGAVLLRIDARPIHADQRLETAHLALGLLGLTLLVVGAGYLLLRRVVLSRVDEIVRVVRSITAGDREVRIRNRETDELGELASTLDEMLDELAVRKESEMAAAEFTLQAECSQKAAMRELASYKTALDQHACVAVSDRDGLITHVNDKFCEITGYTREELIGQTHRVLNSGHHLREFWAELWQRVLDGQVWEGEICNRTKDGSIVWQHTTIVPFKDEQGRVTQFISIRPDITERKLAEEALRDSKEQFELAVRGSNDGIWDWNLITGQVYFSSRFKKLLGYSDDEFPDRASAVRRRMHAQDAPAAVDSLRVHLRGGGAYDVNLRLRTKGGAWRWFRVRGEAVADKTGKARRMAGSLSDIDMLKSAQQNFEKAALHDKLTGLPNRTLLLDRTRQMLLRARRSGQYNYAVMFLDFDRFKFVNDSFGHGVGDSLLKEIAARLAGELRSEDSVSRVESDFTAARQGGDEFVILLDGVAESLDVALVAERVLVSLSRPYQLGAHEVHSTASIGIVLGSPEYQCADDLLRDADTAMYEAKRTGKGRYVVFDKNMRHKVQRRVRLEQDLHRAITRNELFLEYQPIVSLRSGALYGVEGLIRWNHPTEGLIGPVEFIPVAEESDLIFRLGEWVMRAGCRDLARWEQSLGESAPAVVSLNLSRKQFNEPRLVDMTRKIMAEASVSSQSIQLEITEDAFASDPASAISMMHALKRLGVRLAIDDFGVGHSSYASLHKFPVDVLKIDRSLASGVSECHDTAALIHSVAVLVKNLGIHLVIEGVEHHHQLIALSELGCDYAQGYFFGKPMRSEVLEEFLTSHGTSDPCVSGAMSFARRWKERLNVFEENLSE